MKEAQLRGHCQCCGNQQAVVKGRMSKHGYTVEHGWFQGVCGGQHFAPMEVSRAQTDLTVATIRKECAELRSDAAKLKAGKIKPAKCKSGKRIQVEDKKRPGRTVMEDEYIAFKDGDQYYQQQAVENAIFQAEHRARQGESFAAYLEKVADDYHGKELMVIAKKEAAKPINRGDKKVSEVKGRVMVALYQEGARVYYYFKDELIPLEDGSGKAKVKRTLWIGTQAWRKLADVEGSK